jgi:hypothetical protein
VIPAALRNSGVLRNGEIHRFTGYNFKKNTILISPAHTHELRDVPQSDALILLQKPLKYRRIQQNSFSRLKEKNV